MNSLDELKNELLSVTSAVYHFHAHKPPAKYIVWAEDGAGDAASANGRMRNQAIAGTVDLFTDDPEDAALWLTAMVGLPWTAHGTVCAFYLNMAKSDHKEGGITFESAEAAGFQGDGCPSI